MKEVDKINMLSLQHNVIIMPQYQYYNIQTFRLN